MHDLREWLPAHEWSSRHHRVVAAPSAVSARCVLELGDADMPVTQALMGIRQLPTRITGRGREPGAGPEAAESDVRSTERMRRLGFVVLRETDEPGVGVAAGFVGRPWQLTLESAVVRGLDPASFRAFDEPGYIKAVTAMWADTRHGGTSRLMTATYIHATDREAARRFGRYWLLVKAFSGLTRIDMLRGVARRAERTAAATASAAASATASAAAATAAAQEAAKQAAHEATKEATKAAAKADGVHAEARNTP